MGDKTVKELQFQFYLSSIKSGFQYWVIMNIKGFNSTLVQLKGFISIKLNKIFKRFNSTLVQLKASIQRATYTSSFSFNSTLVQLKGLLLV